MKVATVKLVLETAPQDYYNWLEGIGRDRGPWWAESHHQWQCRNPLSDFLAWSLHAAHAPRRARVVKLLSQNAESAYLIIAGTQNADLGREAGAGDWSGWPPHTVANEITIGLYLPTWTLPLAQRYGNGEPDRIKGEAGQEAGMWRVNGEQAKSHLVSMVTGLPREIPG